MPEVSTPAFTPPTMRLTAVCRLVEDTAWHPVEPEKMEKWSPVEAAVFKLFLGTPLKLWASIGHWWIWHFDLNK